jgi:DNA-binding transcriptional MerR regulator
MNEYKISSLAKMAGLSVRTLQYYDRIGLLKPSKKTDAGYRVYTEKELLKLQQILFYRELDFPLGSIKLLINKRDFDMVKALLKHRQMLEERNIRTAGLINTIDKTVRKLKEVKTVLKDEELYEGFSKKEIESIKKEVKEKYDPKVVKESYNSVRHMTKEGFARVKEEGEQVSRDFATLMGKDPASDEVQRIVARHYAHINNYYKPTNEMYRGLGKLYVDDDRFRAHYDKYKKDLAFFVHKAIDAFCDKLDKK